MNKKILTELIDSTFPPGIEVAIGYGSGVFEQKGYDNNNNVNNINENDQMNKTMAISQFEEPPMIDMIFVVNDELEWHSNNLKWNSSHYAALPRLLGPSFVSNLQRASARIYYNTLVPMPEKYQQNVVNSNNKTNGKQLMKYGVINKSDFINDLLNWETLYLSGRLQKPVAFLKKPEVTDSSTIMSSSNINNGHNTTNDNEHEINHALETNLCSALSTAILLLPSEFSELDLYKRITSLSYEGDFRMGIAENPNKIDNIVNKGDSFQRFRNLYELYVDDLIDQNVLTMKTQNNNSEDGGHIYMKHTNEFIRNDDGNDNYTSQMLISKLPRSYQHDIKSTNVNNGLLLQHAKHICKDKLQNTVRQFSRTQTLKGVLTAGISKGIIYSIQKILKRLK